MPGDHKQKKKVKDLREKLGKIGKKKMTRKILPGDCLTCGEDKSWHNEYDPETGEGSVLRHHEYRPSLKKPKQKKGKKTNKLSKKIRKESMIQDVDEYYKEKKGKIRKADATDINRVTRWDERTFNKKREMPKSKVREEEDVEIDRSDVELHPYQAIAKLRKRLAKVENYNAEADPEASAGEWINKYRKKRKVRKANGGIAPNFANPSESHDPDEKKKKKQKTALKKRGRLTSEPITEGPIKKPKNKQYLERRKKKDYVKNAKDQIKGKSTGLEHYNKKKSQNKFMKKDKLYRGDFSGNMTPTPEQIEKKKIKDKKEADAAKKLYERRHRGKAKKARIRRATEIIDPREKKKKTVRPGSDVQKVAYQPPEEKKYGLESFEQGEVIDDIGQKNRGRKQSQKIPPSRVRKILKQKGKKRTVLESPFDVAIQRKNRKYKLDHPTPNKRLRAEGFDEEYIDKYNLAQIKERVAEMKVDKDHNHKIQFRVHEGSQYRRASLSKQEGKYAKYWLLNAKQTNGNGWGVSQTSIAKNINKFIGRPFVITAKQWVAESEYGDQFEHPYLPTNNISQIINHQEKFRVGSIVDVIEKDGDYHAVIEMNSKFANMMLPPFCSPAIFQNNPGEADGQISDWEALHLAGLMEDPAYGARIAILKGSCMGTADACSVQFKSAKQAKMVCPKKMNNLKGRLAELGSEDLTGEYEGKGKVALPRVSDGYETPRIVRRKGTILQPGKREAYPLHQDYDFKSEFQHKYEDKKPFKGKAKDYGKKKAIKAGPRTQPEDIGDILTISETNAERWAKLKGRLAAVRNPKKAGSVDNTIDKLINEVKDPANKEDLVKRLGTTPNEHGPKNYGATKAKDFSSRKKVSKKKQKISKVRRAMMPPEDPLNWLQHYEEEGFVEKKSKEGYNFPVKQLKDESKAVSTRNYRKKVNPPKLTRPSRTGHGATWKGPGTSAAYTSLKELEKGAKIAKLRQRLAIIGKSPSRYDYKGRYLKEMDSYGRDISEMDYKDKSFIGPQKYEPSWILPDGRITTDPSEIFADVKNEEGIGTAEGADEAALLNRIGDVPEGYVTVNNRVIKRSDAKKEWANVEEAFSGVDVNTKYAKLKGRLAKVRQRLVRTAKPIIQETGLGIKYKHNRPIEPTSEIAKEGYGYHKVPFHPTNAILIRPNEPKDFMKMVKHLRKVVTTREFSNLPHGMNDRVSLPLRYLKNEVKYGDKFGTGTLGEAVDKLKHHATISTATNKAFKKGDILMRRVGGKPTPGADSIYKYGGVGDTYYIEEDSPKGELFNAPSKYRKPGSQATIDYERSLEKKKLGKLRSATIKPLTKKKKKGKAIKKVSSKSK